MSELRAEEIVKELLAAWNARDLDGLVALLAEDVEWYDPAMTDPPARGKEAVKAFSESVLEAFPDFTFEMVPPLCSSSDGSRCAFRWRITATHSRPLRPMGYAPTNRTATMEGVDVLEIRDGKVAAILTAFDPLPAAEQLLGMKLRPAMGTFRGWMAVALQRLLAFFARRR